MKSNFSGDNLIFVFFFSFSENISITYHLMFDLFYEQCTIRKKDNIICSSWWHSEENDESILAIVATDRKEAYVELYHPNVALFKKNKYQSN